MHPPAVVARIDREGDSDAHPARAAVLGLLRGGADLAAALITSPKARTLAVIALAAVCDLRRSEYA
jgi:hypothetical protein